MKKYFGLGLLALLTTAYLTSSCSRDDFSGSLIEAKKAAFDDAFKEIYGIPDPQHTWGFGDNASTRAFTRANPGETYPATHEYKDANGNVIAGANMNSNHWADPDDQWGGWLVPDPLTAGQKERVRLYFQANPDLDYVDPHFRHFFVQQVYTGGTSAPTTGNHEATASADGQTHVGMTLNKLTVGEACSHINNFNAGTRSPSNVLDNGQKVNGTTHSDQITLMVNVYDTSCFGYHETSGSNTSTNNNHNDKMALVDAATIDAWAAQNGYPGEAVTDSWNRSFMGFDYELLPESDIIMEGQYALLSQVPSINDLHYAWDGQKLWNLGPVPESTETTKYDDFDLTPYFANHAIGDNGATCTKKDGKIYCYFPQWSKITFGQGEQDWSNYSKLVIQFESSPINGTVMYSSSFSIGDTEVEVNLNNNKWSGDNDGPVISTYDGSTGTLVITSVKLIGKTIEGTTVDPSTYYNPTYLLGDADNQKISFYSENLNMYGGIVFNFDNSDADHTMTTTEGYLDLTKFQTLVANGYHPTSTDLKRWVKWQAACDGYYSDWIVTLTQAQRINEDIPAGNYETVEVQRIIDGRIFCEDLGSADHTDIDYNDVVFDAFTYITDTYKVPYTWDLDDNKVYEWAGKRWEKSEYDKTDITLLAAGGTIPITVAERDVNELLDIVQTKMANTYVENVSPNLPESNVIGPISPAQFTVYNSSYTDLREIPILVRQDNHVDELDATIGDVPHKFRAPVGTPWLAERVSIENGFSGFSTWVGDRDATPWGNANQENLYHLKFSSRNGREIGGGIVNWQNYVNWNYSTIEVNGFGNTSGAENFITVRLDNPLEEGDQIAITAFRDSPDNARGSLYLVFNGYYAIADTQIYNNIAYGAEANTFVWTVSSAMAGGYSFQLSRNLTDANIQITGITIISGLRP